MVSDLFPHLATCVGRHRVPPLDDGRLADPRLGPAPDEHRQHPHGSLRLGSWVNYGLGQQEREPARVASSMLDPTGGPIPERQELVERLHAGDVPGTISLGGHAGARPRQPPPPAANLETTQRRVLDTLNAYNSGHSAARADNTQPRRPARQLRDGLLDAARTLPRPSTSPREPEETKELYGLNDGRPRTSAAAALLARRLVERGVRFVQLYAGGTHNDSNWDAHGDLVKNHTYHAGRTDKPIAALLQRPQTPRHARRDAGDLGRRVRPPAHRRVRRGDRPRPQRLRLHHVDGRRRHQGGLSVGETDEIGARAVADRFHVKNLHATVLQQMGLDPEEARLLLQRARPKTRRRRRGREPFYRSSDLTLVSRLFARRATAAKRGSSLSLGMLAGVPQKTGRLTLPARPLARESKTSLRGT